MNKHFAALILAITTATATHAADSGAYLGLATGKHGTIDATSRTGQRVESDHSGLNARLYGGYRLNATWAIEAGYATFGTYTLPNVGPGTAGDASVKIASVYTGVKASLPVGERFDLFGKLNLVHTRFDVAGLGASDESINRLMPGIGAALRLTPTVKATLEVTRYGNATIPRVGKLHLNRFEAGLQVSF